MTYAEHAALIAEMPQRAEERARAEVVVREVRAVTPEELIERYGPDAIRAAAKLLKEARKAGKAAEGEQQTPPVIEATVSSGSGVSGQVGDRSVETADVVASDTLGDARVIDRSTEITPLPPEG